LTPVIPALAGAYVATLPLLQSVIATAGPKRVVVADIVLAALLAAVARRRRAWLRAPWRDLVLVACLPPLAVALCGALETAAAPGPDLTRVIYSMAVLLVFAHLRLSASQLDRIAWTWVVTACLTCLAGLLAFIAVTVFGAPPNALAAANSPNLGPGVTRVASTAGANALALYLQPSLALCLYLIGRPSGADRWLRYAPGLLVLTAALTFSRSLVGVLLVVTLAACGPGRLRWLSRRRNLLAVATGALLIATVAATIWAVFPLRAGRLNTRPNAYRVLHAGAIRMFAARPLTGVGPDAFGRRFAEFTTPDERRSAWPPLRASIDLDPHSTWLGWAAEGGLLGLAGWTLVYGFVVHRLLDTPQADLSRLCACGLAGLAVSGFAVDISHLKFVWCFLGLGLSARAAARE
jgi:O-antigen ligase